MGVVTYENVGEFTIAFAGKPAPTRGCGNLRIRGRAAIFVGVVIYENVGEFAIAFAGKPAHTRGCGNLRIRRRAAIFVGVVIYENVEDLQVRCDLCGSGFTRESVGEFTIAFAGKPVSWKVRASAQ